jgi:hypothetical protein
VTGLAGVALWLAVGLAALITGMLVPRWRTGSAPSRSEDLLLLLASGAAVVAVSATAGVLLTDPLSAIARSYVPIEATPAYRAAAMLAAPGGVPMVSGAVLLLVAAFADTRTGGRERLALVASAALMWAAWIMPDGTAGDSSSVPPYLQAPAAAVAPALALASALAAVTWGAYALAAGRWDGRRNLLLSSWFLATLSLGMEQVARAQLGIGPQDAVVFGSAASGLVLWLVISAVLHRTVLRRLPGATGDVRANRTGFAAHVAHAGALLFAVSFVLHIVAVRSDLLLPSGQRVETAGALGSRWSFVNQGISRYDANEVEIASVAIAAARGDGEPRLVTPELREHHTAEGAHFDTPVRLRRSVRDLTQEVRVVLIEADSTDSARVRVTFLPAPFLAPASMALLVLSFVMMVAAPRPQAHDSSAA